MALQLTQGELLDMRSKAERIKAAADRMKAAATAALGDAIDAVVTQTTAFGFAVANGRYQGVEVVGIPLDLGTGVAMHLLGFLGVGGKYARYLHSVGNGATANYIVNLGNDIGQKWRTKALAAGGSGTNALPGASAKGAIGEGENKTDAQIADILRRAAVQA